MVLGRKGRAALAALLVVALIAAVAPAVLAGNNPAAPYNLKVGTPDSSSTGCLRLTWNVDQPSLVSAFRVYRSEGPESGFKQVYSDTVDMTSGKLMDHFDSGLKSGATYYYKVALVGKSGKVTGTTDVARGTLRAKTAATPGGYPGKHIIISIYDQRIYFLENDVLVKSHLCSTGVDSKPTPTGVFSIQWHAPLCISEKYGGAYCYWWMNFAPDTGMHALPYNPGSGTWAGASLLGHKASHGCVRQSYNDAKWAYDWTPDGTRVDVSALHWEAPPPPPAPASGGSASEGISKASTDWYLAEGCTSGTFDEYVLMMNPNAAAANVTASFMKPDGSVVNGSYVVPALSRYTVHVDNVGGLDNTEVSTKLHSDQPITAERSMYFKDYKGKDGGTCSAGASATSTEWYLAEGYTGGDFDEYILALNPGDSDGTVHIKYMLPGGRNVDRDYAFKAHSRLSVHVDDVPELASTDVSAKVTCEQPIVVERAQYFNYYGKNDGNASTGITTPAKKWYLAEGYTGGDFDEYVLIQNPGDTATKANVTFMCSDGVNVKRSYDLAARSRFSIHVDEIPELANKEVSTQVDAKANVIVERSMYFVSYGRDGGADAPGVSEAARFWYLAEGYTGGDYDTYVLVMNPNDTASKVDISFLKPDGTQVGTSFSVAAHSRYTVHVDAIQGLTDAEFATALTGEKPVICERAMYFSFPKQ